MLKAEKACGDITFSKYSNKVSYNLAKAEI